MKKTTLRLAALILTAAPLSLSAATVYWDSNGVTTGAGSTPTGIWGSSSFWSPDSNGEAATLPWAPGDTAIFSAGTDATNAYTVTVTGTQDAGGIVVEEGLVTLAGGAVNLGAGFVGIPVGATLSTDSSLRISATVGSVWTLDGGTLQTTNGAAAGSFIDTDAVIVLGPGGGTLSYNVPNVLNIVNSSAANTVGTTISGSGSLTKTGVGVLAIATVSSYTGATIVNEGELRLRSGTNRLPITTALTVNSPGILNINGSGQNQQVASLSGNGTVGTGTGTLTIDGSVDTTFTGVLKNIANGGAAAVTTGNGRLVKNGSSVITFGGLNDINGSVTLNAGGITVALGASLCGPIADLTVNGGVLTLNNAAQAIENLAGTGGTINLAAGHVLTSEPILSTTYAGIIAGAGGLTKLNASATTRTLTLSGANTYDGITTLTKGIIAVGSDTALGSTLGGTEVASGGEVRFDGATATYTIAEAFKIAGIGSGGGGAITIQNLSAPTLTGPVVLTADATVTVSSTATGTFSNANAFTSAVNGNLTLQGGSGAGGGGTISGAIALGAGGLTKLQGGKWTLLGVNTYTGTTTIGAGILQLGSGLTGGDGTISNSTSVINNASLVFNRFGDVSHGGAISGSGTITKSGPGAQTLSGVNSYAGLTTVSNGTLKVGNPLALGFGGLQTTSTATTSVSAGATLDLNGTSAVIEPIVITGTGVSGLGALINSAGTVASTGTGIAGAQVPAVTGTGSGYATAPTVAFAGTGSGGAATATLGVTAASFTIAGGTTVYSAAPSVTIAGGSGAAATVVLTAGVVSGITITNAGTGFTGAPTITFTGGTVTTAGTLPTGTGVATEFTVSGIALTASGTGYTGTPTYTFGSGNATPGTVTLASVALAGNSSIGGTGDLTIASPITEIGIARTLTKVGSGTLTISGAQTYSALVASEGRTNLNSSLAGATITEAAGALLNVNASATGSTVTINGSADISVSQTLAALNIGAGGIVRLGAPAFAPAPDFDVGGNATQAVPEPGALALLAFGALGIFGRRRVGK